MARYRGQKALYEVIGKRRSRRNDDIEPLHPETNESSSRSVEPAGIPLENRWRRPRAIQFNTGKVELTLSYPVALVCLLVLLLSQLGVYRLGQLFSHNDRKTTPATEPCEPVTAGSGSLDIKKTELMGEADAGNLDAVSAAEEKEIVPSGESRRNAISILSYRDRTQLVPVREYFHMHGIGTEILRVESGFILVTNERFRDDPARLGSDGYELRQKIVELGANYRHPSGYLGFTRESFEGAHGVLIE